VTNEGFDEGVDTVDALLREAEKGLHLADLITAHQQLLTTTERLIAHPALPRIERLALIAGMRGTILAALAKVGVSALPPLSPRSRPSPQPCTTPRMKPDWLWSPHASSAPAPSASCWIWSTP
jgi:hypothetical protein